MKKVYLSFAPEDAERAEELRRILMAQGHRPWIDPQPLAGANWHYEMDTAIQAADALIVIVTVAAAHSSYVTYEWALAVGVGLPVFALVYEEAPEHPRLSTVKRYDARSFSDENHFWDHFLGDFNGQLARAAADRRPATNAAEESLDIDKSVMPTEPGYWLVMRRGPLRNQIYQLERELVNIGRDLANDIAIRDGQVSRYHLRLNLQGQDYHLQDLGSTNGTRVNGLQVSQRTRLNDGDIIALGDSILLTYDLVYLE
ncbi:MAG: FHA domain-containing protein [Chloroflexi bacterium]|nr:FHA domain-containing protein [Chloroflexota bacterium]